MKSPKRLIIVLIALVALVIIALLAYSRLNTSQQGTSSELGVERYTHNDFEGNDVLAFDYDTSQYAVEKYSDDPEIILLNTEDGDYENALLRIEILTKENHSSDTEYYSYSQNAA